jgi:hypothetical protein
MAQQNRQRGFLFLHYKLTKDWHESALFPLLSKVSISKVWKLDRQLISVQMLYAERVVAIEI